MHTQCSEPKPDVVNIDVISIIYIMLYSVNIETVIPYVLFSFDFVALSDQGCCKLCSELLLYRYVRTAEIAELTLIAQTARVDEA